MSNQEPRLTGTKVCSKCGRELPVISFAVHKVSSDGLHSYCRDCGSTYTTAHKASKTDKPSKALRRASMSINIPY